MTPEPEQRHQKYSASGTKSHTSTYGVSFVKGDYNRNLMNHCIGKTITQVNAKSIDVK